MYMLPCIEFAKRMEVLVVTCGAGLGLERRWWLAHPCFTTTSYLPLVVPHSLTFWQIRDTVTETRGRDGLELECVSQDIDG